jgi:hypothetical protein
MFPEPTNLDLAVELAKHTESLEQFTRDFKGQIDRMGELLAMQAENYQRLDQGKSIAYSEGDFRNA